jgi:hypothetical protein
MVQEVIIGLSLHRPGFNSRPIHVELARDKVALGQVWTEYFGFSWLYTVPVGPTHWFIHHWCYTVSATDTLRKTTTLQAHNLVPLIRKTFTQRQNFFNCLTCLTTLEKYNVAANCPLDYRKMQHFKIDSGRTPNWVEYRQNAPKYNSEQTGEVPIFRKTDTPNFRSTREKCSCKTNKG